MNKTREQFEEWVQSEFDYDVTKISNGTYVELKTFICWESWLESRKNITIELPENCKGKALTVDDLKVMLDAVGIELKGE